MDGSPPAEITRSRADMRNQQTTPDALGLARGSLPSNTDIQALKRNAILSGKLLALRHLLGFAINFSAMVVLARCLGPEIIGFYFIAYIVLQIMRQVVDFGVRTHFIRLPHTPTADEIKVAFGLQQAIALGVGLLLLCACPIIARWFSQPRLLILLASATLGGYFYSFQSVPLAFLEREMNYAKVGVIEVAEAASFSLLAAGFALGHMGIFGLVAGNICRGFIPALLALLLARRRPAFSFETKKMRGLAIQIAPIASAGLMPWIVGLAPPILIGNFASASALGLAQLGYTALGYPNFIATVIQRVSLAALSKLHHDNVSFADISQKILRLLVIIYAPIIMGMASFSPWLIPLIYGPKWSGMDEVMLAAALPISLAAIFAVITSALYSKGQAKVVLQQSIINLILYWSAMAIFVYAGLKHLAMPLSDTVAITSTYLLLGAYKKHCGDLDYRHLLSRFLMGFAAMVFSWACVKAGALLPPILLWACFLTFLFYTERPLLKALYR